jgi:hypothetical protein
MNRELQFFSLGLYLNLESDSVFDELRHLPLQTLALFQYGVHLFLKFLQIPNRILLLDLHVPAFLLEFAHLRSECVSLLAQVSQLRGHIVLDISGQAI